MREAGHLGSKIPAQAKKCRHCGETLDHTMRAVEDLKNQQQFRHSQQPMVFMNAGGGSSVSEIPFQQSLPTIVSCPQTTDTNENFHWTSIVSFISGVIIFIGTCSEPDGKWDDETVTGIAVISFVPIIFGIISLASNHKKRWMAMTGIILGVLVFIIALGSK